MSSGNAQIHPPLRRDGRLELRLTVATLVLVMLGLCVVGKRTATWPIITWPMYGTRVNELPPPTTSHVEMRIVHADGTHRRVVSDEIFPMGRSGPARRLFVEAFEHVDPTRREPWRQYLAGLVLRNQWAIAPFTIEVWEYEWDVDPLKVPPLEYGKPSERRRLGAFEVSADGRITLSNHEHRKR